MLPQPWAFVETVSNNVQITTTNGETEVYKYNSVQSDAALI